MAFGFGFALTAIAKAVGFSPSSLFSSGAQGAWYDPSDLTTLFEDSAGTTPITSPLEKPVGLMLDKSRGLVLGSEKWTGSPTLAANWSGTNGTYTSNGSSGFITIATVNSGYLTVGKVYKTVFTVTNATSGSVSSPYDGDGLNQATKTVNGTYERIFRASADGLYIYSAAFVGTVSNISVKELPGNHAFQSTTTSRPTLSARYNLLTKTEDFGDAAWSKLNVSVASGVSDPLGGLTAFTITGSGAGPKEVYQLSTGANYLQSLWIRRRTGSGTIKSYVDGAYVSWGTVTSNWTRFSLTQTTAASPSYFLIALGTAGDAVDVWHPDLRVANDGVGLPAYQRVNTATDYDYAGFPPYLKFDGTDDGMATGNIDFSGTDKMFVAAGVRKLVDSATSGVIAETSVDAGGNNGAFILYAQDTGKWKGLLRGTATIYGPVSGTFNAPITNVLTQMLDIGQSTAANELRMRVNGADQTITFTGGDAGTGNYGNYPLYIGRRGGTTLPFNGRIYSLIVCGKLASAAEIASTENWVEAKTFGKDMNYVYSDEVLTAASEQITTADGQNVYMTVTYQ